MERQERSRSAAKGLAGKQRRLIQINESATGRRMIGVDAMEDQVMSENYRQALVGDFGGTYITLAISDIDELSVSNFALLNTADFDDPMQAVERYLKSVPSCPDKVAFALAGTVTGETAAFEHRDWHLNHRDIRAATGAKHVLMINDIEAATLMVPHLSRYDTVELRAGHLHPYANRALAICGAGMNMAGLVHHAGDWVPVTGKAGLEPFRLAADDPAELGTSIFASGPTYDEVFTGRGLVALYSALAGAESGKLPSARKIANAGLSGEDPVAVRSLQVMATWLGRMAGDMALRLGAKGGIYLGGGLVANTVPALQTGHFEQALLGTGRRADYLADIPVRVVKMAADAAMRGAALAFGKAHPQPVAAPRRTATTR